MLRLKTFGGLYLETGAGTAAGRGAQRRRLALLVRLAAARGAPVSRDKLIALFWPEHETAAARHALSQAVYELRRTIGEAALPGGPSDDLRLDPTILPSDVAAFGDAVERGDLAGAVDLYGGPFLDGVFVDDAPEFERWAEGERARLARACAGALEAIARSAADEGAPSRAADAWRRLGALEPLEASVALATMRALAAAGERAGALREAARHAAALRAELDDPPDPEVEALAARLRAEPTEVPRARGAPAPTAHRRAGGRRAAVLFAGAALVAGGLAMATQLTSGANDREPRAVVLGSVTSNDPALGLAIREALRAELDATAEVLVFPDAGLREALRRMARPPDTAVSGELAIEVAQRNGIPLAVVGSAVTVGGGMALAVRVLDAATGRVLASSSAQPAGSDEVLDAVARLARTIRERVTGVRIDTLPALPPVTTTSLPALRSYVLARRAAGTGDRRQAVELAEAALVHDSAFVLAHYLLGDLLWFTDVQRRSEFHLTRAFRLSDRLPPRERLIVRARYEQLVADRPDSALVLWRLMRGAYRDDPHAPEGMSWAFRALGDFAGAAAAADTAMRLDVAALTPNVSNRIHALLAAGDVAAARTATSVAPHWTKVVEFFAAMSRGDVDSAERVLRRAHPAHIADPYRSDDAYWWQLLELARGRLVEAERAMTTVVAGNQAQASPRALLAQARAELAFGGSAEHAAALAREAFDWMRRADLSPPAYARLAERVADVAARAGDAQTLDAVGAFIRRQDAGRGLRTYRMAEETIEVCRAWAAGDYARAAALARTTRDETYFWRTISIIVLLEADARAALGDTAAAATAYRSVLAWPVPLDADYETWPVLRAIAARALASGGPAARGI